MYLWCPHCDEYHPDSKLTILAELDYVECNIAKREIHTWMSASAIVWRGLHDFE